MDSADLIPAAMEQATTEATVGGIKKHRNATCPSEGGLSLGCGRRLMTAAGCAVFGDNTRRSIEE